MKKMILDQGEKKAKTKEIYTKAKQNETKNANKKEREESASNCILGFN